MPCIRREIQPNNIAGVGHIGAPSPNLFASGISKIHGSMPVLRTNATHQLLQLVDPSSNRLNYNPARFFPHFDFITDTKVNGLHH